MTATETIIKDAMEGGWMNISNVRLAAGYIKGDVDDGNGWTTKEKIPVAEALLDPTFWQAVGKTRGWDNLIEVYPEGGWRSVWKVFIDHIADGLTIEDALSALEK